MMDIFGTIFNEDDYDKDNEYDDENDEDSPLRSSFRNRY